ncbi:MAG TPA: hypothetical protein EYH36_07835 [Desulfocapsa sulfexigens]|nr:hypothetical protein [Desulfocapsa sulfexigens]
MVIHKEERIAPDNIPEGSIFKGCNSYVVRGLQIVPFNTHYLLEQWLTPEGKIVFGQLPSSVDGHFDFVLKSFVIYQYQQCHVPQPLM